MKTPFWRFPFLLIYLFLPFPSSAFESIELEEEIRLPPNLQAPADFTLNAQKDVFYVMDGKRSTIWQSSLGNKEWNELAQSPSRLTAVSVNEKGLLAYASKDAVFVKKEGEPQEVVSLASVKALGWDSLGRIWALTAQLNIVDPEGGLQTSFGDFGGVDLMETQSPSNAIVIYNSQAKKLISLDAKGSPLKEIDIQKNMKLTAFCVDEFDWTYIATQEGKILEFSPTGTLSGSFGRRGQGYGEFGAIQKLSCAKLGELWALDSKNKKIARLTVKNPDKKTPLTAKFVSVWSFIIRDQKQTPGSLKKIVSPAQSKSLWLALSDKKGAIATQEASGEIKIFGPIKDETGQDLKLDNVDAIEATPDASELYVLETKKSRVLRVNAAKVQVLTTLGGKGSGLRAPRDVLVQGGRLYVAEKDKIHVYTPKGIFLDTFGPAVPVESGGDSLRFENLTRLRGRPETGWIFALDSFQSKIFVFDSNAKLLSVVGQEPGDKDNPDNLGVLNQPQDMTLDPYGHLYVLTANTIELFALRDKIFDFVFRWPLPKERVGEASSLAWSNQKQTKNYLALGDSKGKTLSAVEVRYTSALSPDMFTLEASSGGVQISFVGAHDFKLNQINLYRSNSALTSNMGTLKNLGAMMALNTLDTPEVKAIYFYWARAKSLWSGHETPYARLNDGFSYEKLKPEILEAPKIEKPKIQEEVKKEEPPAAPEISKPEALKIEPPVAEEPKISEPTASAPTAPAEGKKEETSSTETAAEEPKSETVEKPESVKEPETAPSP